MGIFPPAPNNANRYLAPVAVVPGNLLITNITNAYPMVVTIEDSDLNTYQAGQDIRLTIPRPYGMYQADGKIGKILEIDNLDFHIDIDSRSFDVFTTPGHGNTISRPPSLSCAGSRNLQFNNETINNVPVHNLNNIGN